MLKTFVEEAAALASITLFVGMIVAIRTVIAPRKLFRAVFPRGLEMHAAAVAGCLNRCLAHSANMRPTRPCFQPVRPP